MKQEAEARAHSLEGERNDAIQVARATCLTCITVCCHGYALHCMRKWRHDTALL